MGSSPLARGLPQRAPCSRPPAPDHPRSRGVYHFCGMPLRRGYGSSPLARGLRDDQLVRRHVPGIIPARAGFTPPSRPASASPPDHPRSRGVYRWPCGWWSRRSGSSPLARGLPSASQTKQPNSRIIPARAGFTVPRHARRRDERDHPRSRGVYDIVGTVLDMVNGSSPLARGLPVRPPPVRGRRRIIPARAGFTATAR